MAGFGIPYMGSKDKIAKEVCKVFPKAENFYDLFGGGFSITHCMLKHRSKDFKYFHFNEIRPGICDLIKDAILGKYSYKNFRPKFISRKEFFEKKETDPYVKIIWSFGNNGETYIFGESIEQHKKSVHDAIIFNEFDDYAKKIFGTDNLSDSYSLKDKRLFLRERISFLNKKKMLKDGVALKRGDLERFQQLQQLEQLERLQRLEQLQQLQRLEQFERLNFYNKSYEQIQIKPNSVIYCDPPYVGTAGYDRSKTFNTKKFLDWADSQKCPVFISEYNISDKRFRLLKTVKKRSLFSPNKTLNNKTEKIYVNKAFGF